MFIIIDSIIPSIVCNDTAKVYLDSSGIATFDTSDFGIVTWDNCDIDSVWLSQDSILCPDDSLNQGWAYVLDKNGNIDSTEGYVLVYDTILPSALCKDVTVYLDSSGVATLLPGSVDNGSYDNCMSAPLSLSKTSFSCANIGLDSTLLYVYGNFGQVDSCQSYVTVTDSINPAVLCKDTTIYLDQLGSAQISAVDIITSYWDNCSIDSLFVSDTTFACSDTGANQVLVIVIDPSGNRDSCTSIVTVLDTLAPQIICPYNIIVMSDPVKCDTLLNIPAPIFSDNCQNPVITYTLSGASSGNGTGSVIDTFYSGITNIKWVVTDIDGNTTSCIQSVTTYTSIVAVADSITTLEDSPVFFNPLDNDMDCDGDILPSSIEVADNVTKHGILIVDAVTANIKYTPDPDFFGNDTLKYKISDSDNFTDSATVYITVTPVNDPPVLSNDYFSVPEDDNLTGTILDGNDYDPEGDSLYVTVAPVVSPIHGVFSIGETGTFSYTPVHNYFGKDTAIISVCDSGIPQNMCSNDTIYFTVTPVNDPPILQNDYIVTYEDIGITSDLLTTYDYDPDSTELTASVSPVVEPSHGEILITPDGTFTYVPELNFSGTDFIVVNVCDADQPSKNCGYDTIFVTINAVNDPPVVDNEYIDILEDATYSGDLIDNGDSDPDGTSLYTHSRVKNPSHGVLTLGLNGDFGYTPYTNYFGSDMAIVSICDNGIPGTACSNDTIFINVMPVNDPPHVVNPIADVELELYSSDIVWLDGVFDDVDGDQLTFDAMLDGNIALPSWITLNSSTQSYLVINPNTNYILGEYLVKVSAFDPSLASASYTFKINVKQAYSISGNVNRRTGTVENPGDNPLPAPDVRIILKDGSTPIDTTITDANGNYEFKGLEAKTYNLVVDLQYYTQSAPMVVALSNSMPSRDDANFTIWTNQSLVTDITSLASDAQIVNLYPNPTVGEVSVAIENNNGDIEITVHSATGEKIFYKEYLNGENIKFDVSGQADGMYFVQVKTDQLTTIKKLILKK